jgi:vacuolar protein-sorting-associated protein 4
LPVSSIVTNSTDEKSDKCKLVVKEKVAEYLTRAEQLKEHLEKESKKPKKPVGSTEGDGAKYVLNDD